ncbi:MAG TPA: hypothetical protein VFQ53_05700 [Kofleriaceae bacterium]|nr:hypothetical protein [Kofleriaceae bacterium]
MLLGWLLALAILAVACPTRLAAAQEVPSETEGAPPPAAKEEKPSTIKAIVGYSLAIGGVVVVAMIVIHTLSKTLKYEQARNAIIHLLRTNPNQAELQCQTLPNSFYDPIGAAIKSAAMTGTQDPAVIAQATVPTYDAIGAVVIQHWKGLVGKAKLAAGAALGGAVVKPAVLPIILAVVAVGGLVWLWIYKAEIDRTIFRAKVEVLPDVDRAFAQGRYYIPPKQ